MSTLPASLPATYRAAVTRTPGGPDSIEIVERPLTVPGPGEVLVKIAAAAVNPVDAGVADGVFHRLGFVHQPEWTGLGWDFSGTVALAGDGVNLVPGSRVAGFVDGFDRDFGSFAEYLVAPVGSVAVVPDPLDLLAASTVPLTGVTGAQIVDLLGDAPEGRNDLLVTGAAGAVGAHVTALAGSRGWRVTGLARTGDESFVRSLGAAFVSHADTGWDAVADGAVLQQRGVGLVRDGGLFVGVQPSAPPTAERGVTVKTVVSASGSAGIADALARSAAGAPPARVHAVVPLADVADAIRTIAKGGVRGRIVLQP